MTSYGEVFHDIRKTRGISIKKLSDDIVSKSTISRFERAESDIAFERLLHILDKLKVSMNEFVYLSSQKQISKSSLELLSKALLENDSDMLKNLAMDEWRNYRKTHDIYAKLSAIIIECHYKEMVGENVAYDSNLAFLTDYFFRCEMWTQFDVVMFANSMSYIPIDTSIVISKEIANKTELFHGNRQSLETVINTLINITMVCLEEDRIQDADEFIKIIERLDMDETFLLEKVIFKFIKGIFIGKKGEKNEGKKLSEEALLVLHLAGSFKLERIFKEYLQKLSM